MVGAHHDPFRILVRMPGEQPRFDLGLALGHVLDGQAILVALLHAAFPTIGGADRPIDLDAGGQTGVDQTAGERVRVLAGFDSRPTDVHACTIRGAGTGASREKPLDGTGAVASPSRFLPSDPSSMRDDYIKEALKVVPDPNLLINVVSRRVKQLKRGSRPLVESLEKLSPEDVALREVIEGKIVYEVAAPTTAA